LDASGGLSVGVPQAARFIGSSTNDGLITAPIRRAHETHIQSLLCNILRVLAVRAEQPHSQWGAGRQQHGYVCHMEMGDGGEGVCVRRIRRGLEIPRG